MKKQGIYIWEQGIGFADQGMLMSALHLITDQLNGCEKGSLLTQAV